MAQELERVGFILRKKREAMQMSLREAESSTSIRARYLQAIEEGTIFSYLSGVYAQGFVKQYARFLGIEIEDLISEYPTLFKKQLKPQERLEFLFGVGTMERRVDLGGGIKWMPSMYIAISIAGLVILGYTVAKALGIA